MTINRTPIEWVQGPNGEPGYTWNPVTGCRGPDGAPCSYCYARRIAQRFGGPEGFEPRLHKDRLDEPARHKKPARIFVCSMGDLFGEWVPDEWIADVIIATRRARQHTYFFLTKNPHRYRYIQFYTFIGHTWWGISASTQADYDRRIKDMPGVGHCFASLEPLHGPVDLTSTEAGLIIGWLIIGAQTGPGAAAARPKREWVNDLIVQCRKYAIPVFCKNNLRLALRAPDLPQEWPPSAKETRV